MTIRSAGYGDLYPATRFGRMCLVVSCFVAVALFALTLNLILAFLSIGRDEENFLRATRYHHARRKLKEAAASVVEAVYMRSPMYQRLKQKDTFKGYQVRSQFTTPSVLFVVVRQPHCSGFESGVSGPTCELTREPSGVAGDCDDRESGGVRASWERRSAQVRAGPPEP